MMDYTREFRKFISSQYLYSGIRITAGAIIPALVLHHYDLLITMMAVPLGALMVSITDSPGPPQHRRNGMLASILINGVVALIVALTRNSPWLIGIEIILFGMFFSLIGVYGNRINSIGLIALLIFIFNIDSRIESTYIWRDAALFTLGGIWYALMSLALHTIRPYRPIQQLLGESLMEIAKYLRIKAAFYEKQHDSDHLYKELIKLQVTIHQHQDELHEMIFKARSIITESTSRGRVLLTMYLDSTDLFERIMTTQQEYEQLHQEFDDTEILTVYHRIILQASDELQRIGLAVQEGLPYRDDHELQDALKETTDAFMALREKHLSPQTIEGFIKLRHILYSIEDLVERIGILARYSTYDRRSLVKSREQLKLLPLDQQTASQEINAQMLLDNLSLKSSYFRHSVRVTIAMLAGYIISLLYPLGHGYWILLTIVTIMKPAYSITRQRNFHRIGGTILGAALSFGILYVIKNNTALFIIMLIAMIISYSFIKLNYFIGSAGITVYVVLSFHFMSSTGLTEVLTDRVIDTTIGSLIAGIVSTFVLPLWEHEQIDEFILNSIKANRKYFCMAAEPFTGKPLELNQLRTMRKDAFVALGNMSDHFQRMLSEPKTRQPNLPQYHQFVATSHLLTSHIASLSYYAQRSATQYANADFQPLIKQVDEQFKYSLEQVENHTTAKAEQRTTEHAIRMRLQKLFDQRRLEMKTGSGASDHSLRKTLSDLKAITDQFQLIYSITAEHVKILEKMDTTPGSKPAVSLSVTQ